MIYGDGVVVGRLLAGRKRENCIVYFPSCTATGFSIDCSSFDNSLAIEVAFNRL